MDKFIFIEEELTTRRKIFEELVKRPELDDKEFIVSVTFHFSPDGKVKVETREID